MNEIKIANRYAKALFDLTLEIDKLEKVKKDIDLIHNLCLESKDFILMLRSPVIRVDKKTQVINEIFQKKIEEVTLNFLLIITRNKRERLIPEIAIQFVEIYKIHHNIFTVGITTAEKIDEEIKSRILTLLEKRANAKIELNEKVDKEIIGGFVLNYEDKQYDASILRQIKNLRREFKLNLYVKGF